MSKLWFALICSPSHQSGDDFSGQDGFVINDPGPGPGSAVTSLSTLDVSPAPVIHELSARCISNRPISS